MEKFSIEKAQNEAEKIREKVISGEAETFDEAEKIIENHNNKTRINGSVEEAYKQWDGNGNSNVIMEDQYIMKDGFDLEFSQKFEKIPSESRGMEKTSANIPVMRHFDDIDNLFNFGRDGDLIPGQEDKATLIAQDIYNEIKKEDKSAAMFICSSKKRAIQTAGLIIDQLREIDGKLKLRVVAEENLVAMQQGKFLLPPDYKPGDVFIGIDLANKAFAEETFAPDNSNYLYKFGDPVLQDDGSYKHPELVPYFENYGESNRDFLLRIYDLIIRTSNKIDKLNSKTKAVVITHAQLYQVFTDLSTVANMIKNEGLNLKIGELPEMCWSLYSERIKNEKPTYGINFIPIENLYDSEIIELLKREIEYLKNLE